MNGYARVATTPSGFAVYRRPEDRPSPNSRVSAANDKRLRVFESVEATAEDFARWKKGAVERIYRWPNNWCRARIRLQDGKTFCEITRDGAGLISRRYAVVLAAVYSLPVSLAKPSVNVSAMRKPMDESLLLP